MNQAVDALAERTIREHWEFLPTAGSRIGRHGTLQKSIPICF